MLTKDKEFELSADGPEGRPAASVRAPRTISAPTALLPLRLFLGISFLAAGLDKLLDPQFFDASANRYIGNQLAGFAQQSPIGGFLTSFAVPNATLFGAMVLAGELAIALGTLVGLFTRTAAFFGFILSLTLWLTSTWQVTPFFLGSDLPYAMAWLALAIAGAHPILSLDGQIQRWKARQAPLPAQPEFYPGNAAPALAQTAVAPLTPAEQSAIARRRFITVAGATVVTGAVTGVAWMNSLAQNSSPAPVASAGDTPASPTTAPATSASAPATATAPATSTPVVINQQPSTAAGGQTTTAPKPTTAPATAAPTTAAPKPTTAPAVKGPVLAQLSSIPVGSAVSIAMPGTNEPAFVVHEADGSVKAFSAVCTHEGCIVSFSKASQVFACPCHGAEFDIKTGAVLRRPARRPLTSFNVQVDGNGNVIYIQG